uniref:Uncharacterized protein n=1 Tax=Chionoecetes opilio bacilliform virus TaxID=1825681 RepID=A0A1Q3DKY9_9VIRU|nr:hypothetical protein SCV_096 [Chionoecetes opilio bacilliform virus]
MTMYFLKVTCGEDDPAEGTIDVPRWTLPQLEGAI